MSNRICRPRSHTRMSKSTAAISVNITISVPLEAVAAVTRGSDPSLMADALAVITKAAVAGVKALPYDTNSALSTADEEDNWSIKSFDSDEPASAPRPAKKVKRAPSAQIGSVSMQVYVKDLKGRTRAYMIDPKWNIESLKGLIHDRTGFAPDQQRLIWARRQLEDERTFQVYEIPDSSTFHLVERLRGS